MTTKRTRAQIKAYQQDRLAIRHGHKLTRDMAKHIKDAKRHLKRLEELAPPHWPLIEN